MVTIKINETEYNIRTSWNEVTMNQYVEICKASDKPFAEKIAAYTQMPIEIINQMKIAQLNVIGELVEFMEGFDSVNAFAIGYESPMVIGDEPYWKVERAKQLLQNNPLPISAAVEIVKNYTGDNENGAGGIEIGELPVTEVIGMATFFLQGCQLSSNGLKD
ncbi:hypothetical protein UFOVP1106_10 [uncultured Caudovirales phage]|uniref:Uncharacterized protein n=1 Tax=uncultured Caudovirales phage TaxID=2100421 RepID=A0A6J5QVF3_9CAUD|nr:hypothetical protein UFOVP1106_10 [uncultured Caudovirales phage]